MPALGALAGGNVLNVLIKVESDTSKLGQVGMNMTKFVTLPILAAGGAVLKLAADAEQTDARLRSAFESMGAAGWTSIDKLEQKAKVLQSSTTFGDEAIKDAMAVMLTFGDVTGDIFDESILASMNMADALQMDLQGAVIMVGKALNDPERGLLAMRRIGVQFTEAQESMIKSMVASGDTMGAQRIILQELEREFGGTAEAMAGTGAGSMKQAFNAIGDAGESFGRILIPVVASVAEHVKNLAGTIETLDPGVQGAIVGLLGIAAAIGPLILGFKFLLAPILAVNAALLANPIALVVIGIAAIVVAIALLLDKFGLLDDAIGFVNMAFGGLMDIVADLGYRLGGLIGLVIDVLGALVDFGRAIALALSGNFEGAAAAAEQGLGRINSAGENMLRVLGDSGQRIRDETARSAAATATAFDTSYNEMELRANNASLAMGRAGAKAGFNFTNGVVQPMAGLGNEMERHTNRGMIQVQESMLEGARAIGNDIPGAVAGGMEKSQKSRWVLDAANTLRDILKNGLTPEAQAMEVIGRKYVELVSKGMRSEIPGAKEAAQAVAIGAIKTISDAGLTGAKGVRGLEAIGKYYDELLASGMTAAQARVALSAGGVADNAINAIESRTGQANSAGTQLATATGAGLRNAPWTAWGQAVAGSWAAGFLSKIRAAAAQGNQALSTFGAAYRGRSAPRVGPLRHIDEWGAAVARAWVDPFLDVIRHAVPTAPGLGGLAVALGGAGTAPMPAPAAAGGNIYINVQGAFDPVATGEQVVTALRAYVRQNGRDSLP